MGETDKPTGTDESTDKPSVANLREEIERALLEDIKKAGSLEKRQIAVTSYFNFKSAPF